MSHYLSYGEFKWLNKEEIEGLDVNLVSENSLHGYILEVDLECPNKLHRFHIDYPLGTENLEITCDMLLAYCTNIADQYCIKVDNVIS